MQSVIHTTHPSGLGLTYNDADHTYLTNDGIYLTSGTHIVSYAKPKFDPDGSITRKYAEKHGMTVEAVKAQWKAKATASCEFGTRCHANAEFQFLNRPELIHEPREEREVVAFKAIHEFVKHLQSTYTFLSTEQIVFSPDLRIAGSIDLLMAEPSARQILLMDWKSNEKLDRINDFGNKLLAPLDHLDDCNLNHYALQLSLYRRLLIQEGYLKANGFDGWKVKPVILHVNQQTGKIEWIEPPIMQYEVAELIIKHLVVPF